MTEETRKLWVALWRSDNRLDGKRTHILNGADCLPLLFRTRRAARSYIDQAYGYLRQRDDLKAEPHGWKMPIPVRVQISQAAGFRQHQEGQ